MIEFVERNRDDEIERLENGMPEEEDDEADPMAAAQKAWQDMQSLGNEEYLQKTILPVLYQAMKVVDRDRPEAPLEYLALYLLKHQNQIKLPSKPQEM